MDVFFLLLSSGAFLTSLIYQNGYKPICSHQKYTAQENPVWKCVRMKLTSKWWRDTAILFTGSVVESSSNCLFISITYPSTMNVLGNLVILRTWKKAIPKQTHKSSRSIRTKVTAPWNRWMGEHASIVVMCCNGWAALLENLNAWQTFQRCSFTV